jgi:multiple antibiotic resistance protein
VALQALFTALVISAAFVAIGNWIFRVLGLTPADFQIAGGLLLLMIGMREVALGGGAIERVADPNVGPVPLGIPLMVGPAVLTSLMLMVPLRGYTITLAALLANLIIAGLAFRGSRWISSVFSPHALRAVSQVIGLFLAAIAVNLIRHGLRNP